MTALISHEVSLKRKNREKTKKYENYLLVLACAYRANKKRVKNGKKGQKRLKIAWDIP